MHLIEVLVGLLRRDNWRKIPSVDVILMCHDVDRAYDVDGLPYSQLLDPIRQQLEEQGIVCATVAHRFSRLTGRRAWGNPLSINRASLINVFANRAERVMGRKTADDGASQRSIRFWERLLARSGAKLVLLIGAPPEVCAAANRLEIRVVELLHGFGYVRIPWGYEKREDSFRPTDFVAFDSLSLRVFSDHFSIERVSLACRNNSPKLTIASDKEKMNGAIRVLVTLGWKEDMGSGLAEVQVCDVVPEQIKNAIFLSRESITWLVRPHPVMMRERRFLQHRKFLELFVISQSNCTSLQQSTNALDAVLEGVRCHVTMMSEAAYEASFRGIPTLFLSSALEAGRSREGTFKDLVDSGDAEIQPDFSGQQIVDWALRRAAVVRGKPVTTERPLASDVVVEIFHRAAVDKV